MCEQCTETINRVVARTGIDPETVRRVHDAVADDIEQTHAEDALTAAHGRPVRPYLLGTEPYILLTVRPMRPSGNGVTAVVSLEYGGGLPEDFVEAALRRGVDAWPLRATGGVTADGAVVGGFGETL
jgi:hypothetical protein